MMTGRRPWSRWCSGINRNSTVTLLFEGEIGARFTHYHLYDNSIFSAAVLFENGTVYWAEGDPETVADIGQKAKCFSGSSLRWKMVTGTDEHKE